MTPTDLLELLQDVKPAGSGEWTALCPAHDDNRRSLSVGTGDDGKVLLHCHAGCEVQDIVATLGLTQSDLFPDKPKRPRTLGRIVATYDYTDSDGKLLFQTVRYKPKDFRQRRPDGAGGWLWNLDGVIPALYHLPALLAADPDVTVFVVEGEKDVATLEAWGLLATTNAMGAGKWRPDYAETLAGRRVVILPHNDGPGRKHAEDVARSLYGVAADVRVVDLVRVWPDIPEKGDVSDWANEAGTAARLLALVDETEPWQPPATSTGPATEATATGEPDGPYIVSSVMLVQPEGTDWYVETYEGRRTLGRGVAWAYNGGLWRQIEPAVTQSEVFENWLRHAKIQKNTGDGWELVHVNALKGTASAIASMALVRLAPCDEHGLPISDPFDQAENLFNFTNGTLDLDSGQLKPHDPGDYLTGQVEYPYDPNATAPRWQQFLEETQVDAEGRFNHAQAGFLQQFAGYLLRAHNRGHFMLILYGTGANGKSVFLDTLAAMMGPDAVVSPDFDKIDHEYTAAAMIGRRLAICDEAPDEALLKSGPFKRLVTGALVPARHPYGRPFTGRFTGKIVWACNELPSVTDPTEGMWRRIRVVPFLRAIPPEQQDQELTEKLRTEELSGIFNWALQGLRDLEGEGWVSARSVVEATAQYREYSDRIRLFADDCLVLGDGDVYVTSGDLYRAYSVWCRDNGLIPRGTSAQLAAEWVRLGLTQARRRVNGRVQRCWVGAGLAENSLPA